LLDDGLEVLAQAVGFGILGGDSAQAVHIYHHRRRCADALDQQEMLDQAGGANT